MAAETISFTTAFDDIFLIRNQLQLMLHKFHSSDII